MLNVRYDSNPEGNHTAIIRFSDGRPDLPIGGTGNVTTGEYAYFTGLGYGLFLIGVGPPDPPPPPTLATLFDGTTWPGKATGKVPKVQSDQTIAWAVESGGGATIDTDPTFAANSDLIVPSQKAVKTAAAASLASGARTVHRDDYTAKADGVVPTTADSGQSYNECWTQNDAGRARVVNGALQQINGPAGSHANYLERAASGKPITRMGVRFTVGSGGAFGSVLLIPWESQHTASGLLSGAALIAPNTRCHMSFGPTLAVLSTIIAGVQSAVLKTWYYTINQDGTTVYQGEYFLLNGQIIVALPDGTIDSFAHVDIKPQGDVACLEHYMLNGDTDAIVRVLDWWSDEQVETPNRVSQDAARATRQLAAVANGLPAKVLHGNQLDLLFTQPAKTQYTGNGVDLRYGNATLDAIRRESPAATFTDVRSVLLEPGGSQAALDATTDRLYFGHSFNSWLTTIYLRVATAGAGYTPVWEYSKGSGVWGTVTPTDGTAAFTQDGLVTFSAPSDWATDTVNGTVAYWLRVRTTTTPTTNLRVSQMSSSPFSGLFLYCQAHGIDKSYLTALGNLKVSGGVYPGDGTEGRAPQSTRGLLDDPTNTRLKVTGRLAGITPTATDDLATKAYIDAAIATVPAGPAGPSYQSNLRPTGALAATFARHGAAVSNVTVLVSQREHLVAIDLPIGLLITSITFMSGTQALVTGSNQWFALHDSARALLRQTVDDGATAWAASTPKPLALTSTFTTTYAGLHYLGINVNAATVPSLEGVLSVAAVNGVVPITNGSSSTGLTGTAPNPAAAISALGSIPWAWVS